MFQLGYDDASIRIDLAISQAVYDFEHASRIVRLEFYFFS